LQKRLVHWMQCEHLVMKELNMDYITQLQKEYVFFTDMLKRLERKKKKTPGNGFAMMKCRERIAEMEAIFDKIDYATQVTYD